MDMKNKKGQVAMEFLLTYGWSFIMILMMIGALVYFGVFDNLLNKEKPQFCPDNTDYIWYDSLADEIICSANENFTRTPTMNSKVRVLAGRGFIENN